MKRRFPPRRDEGPPVNERVLRFREVRVVGSDGSQLGIMTSREALDKAYQEGLDLVMVAAQAQPPVCRIVDNGKFKYENSKRARENKKKTQDVKGIKMRPNIAENDMNTLLRHANKFLDEGDKVRVTCQFRPRELAHPEIGRRKMDTFAERLTEVAVVEKPAALEGRLMIMVLSPKPGRVIKEKGKDDTDSATTVDKDGNLVLVSDSETEAAIEAEDMAEAAATSSEASDTEATPGNGAPPKKKKPEKKLNKRGVDILHEILGEKI